MAVANVWDKVAPETVSPLSKSINCAPSAGLTTPPAGPLIRETVPGPPRIQPVTFVDPLGRAWPPRDTTGDSKLPFENAVGGESGLGEHFPADCAAYNNCTSE